MFTKLFQTTLALGALACASCGSSSALYPVTGRVLYHGEPAAGASVTFVRKDSPDRFNEITPQGIVAADGTFSLAGPAGDGAAPGEYVVLIEWKEGAGTQPGRAPALSAPDRLKKKYLDPNNPQLTATVQARATALPPFEVE